MDAHIIGMVASHTFQSGCHRNQPLPLWEGIRIIGVKRLGKLSRKPALQRQLRLLCQLTLFDLGHGRLWQHQRQDTDSHQQQQRHTDVDEMQLIGASFLVVHPVFSPFPILPDFFCLKPKV